MSAFGAFWRCHPTAFCPPWFMLRSQLFVLFGSPVNTKSVFFLLQDFLPDFDNSAFLLCCVFVALFVFTLFGVCSASWVCRLQISNIFGRSFHVLSASFPLSSPGNSMMCVVRCLSVSPISLGALPFFSLSFNLHKPHI